MDIDGCADFSFLGRGGFSRVYKARELAFDREVAVKILQVDVEEEAARLRFLQECELSGRLTGHPNVITVFGAGFIEESGEPYIKMEYAPGGSLAAAIAADGPLSAAAATRTAVLLAGALESAHRHSVIHRDVKPQNVVFRRTGEPALTDFGIASISGYAATSMSAQALTPLYASPELFAGEPADEAGDLYGLGATLYFMLSGEAPHGIPGDNPAVVLGRVLHDEPRPIDRPGVTGDLWNVIAAMLSKSPADRPVLTEVIDELNRIERATGASVTHATVIGAPDSGGSPRETVPVDRSRSTAAEGWDRARRSRRNKRGAIALTAVVTAGAIVAATQLWPDQPADRDRVSPPSTTVAADPSTPGVQQPVVYFKPTAQVTADRAALTEIAESVRTSPLLGTLVSSQFTVNRVNLDGVVRYPVKVTWLFTNPPRPLACQEMLSDPIRLNHLEGRSFVANDRSVAVSLTVASTGDHAEARQLLAGLSMELRVDQGECAGKVIDSSTGRLSPQSTRITHQVVPMPTLAAGVDDYNSWTGLTIPNLPNPVRSFAVVARRGRSVVQLVVAAFTDTPLTSTSVDALVSDIASRLPGN